MTIILWQADVFVTCSVVNTITGWPLQVTVRPMLWERCPLCLLTLFITIIYCGQTVGWIKDGVQVGNVPSNVLGEDSASPPHGKRQCSGREFRELLLLANWCNPATRSDSKSQIKKWSTSNKRRAKGADLQIVTSCHCGLSSWFWTLLYDKVNLAKTVDVIIVIIRQ